MIKDWVKEAAESIWAEHYCCEDIEEIIRKHCPMKPNTAYVELGEAERLASLLLESRRPHYHCEDSWFCCGKCRHPDHQLEHDNDWLPNYPNRRSGICNCGSDAYNRRVDEAVKGYVNGKS